jgi:hypothetical protein
MLRTIRRSLAPPACCCAVALAALPAVAQNQIWIRQLGTTDSDAFYATAPDGSGGVYAGGMSRGSLGGPNAGGEDVLLASYGRGGNNLWIRQIGTSAADWIYAAAPDGSGGVYVSGQTLGSLGGPSAGGYDVWLARYDSAGNQLWIRQFGTNAEDWAYAAAPDSSGGVYVGGRTEGSLGGSNAGLNDAWFAHYDGAGNQLWIRQLGTNFEDFITASAPDGSGGVYVDGWTEGSLGGPHAGQNDAWLARYDSAGNQLWIRQFGTSLEDRPYAAGPDGSGGVYVGGLTAGNLGGPNAGGYDAWFAHYDNAGFRTWIRQLGTPWLDQAFAAAADGSGGVYVCGITGGDLGGPSAGGFDAWLADYDRSGSQIWMRQLGTISEDDALAVATDGTGGVYVGGGTWGSLGGPNTGNYDAWLARFGSTVKLICEPGVASVIPCPCSNAPSGRDRGCNNSAATGGAMIQTQGADSLVVDTLTFVASGENSTALSLLVQGTTALSSGAVYGQGVRCVSGTLNRLFNRNASAGSVTLPDLNAGDPTISARSASLGNPILAGQSRWYLVYYRDPVVLGGCPPSSIFNCGPTMQVNWGP